MTTIRHARGDTRPCTSLGCLGTLQFARETENSQSRGDGAPRQAIVTAGSDRMAWLCSRNPAHIRFDE